MMLYQVESRVPGLSMISNLVKSRVYGCDPSIFDMPPFSPAEDEKAKVMKPVDDSRLHFGHEDLSAALGVIKRPAAGTNPELTAHLENFMRYFKVLLADFTKNSEST
jgi:hypothetical protein